MTFSLFNLSLAVCLTISLLISPSQAQNNSAAIARTIISSPSHLSKNFEHFFRSGITETAAGKYQQALSDFTQTIKLKPDFAPAYSDRCLVQMKLQNYVDAKQDCTKAIQLQSYNESAYLNRGLAHYQLGEYAAAIADYHNLLNWKPNSLEANYNLGLAHSAQKEYKEALADYDRALDRISSADRVQLATIYNSRGSVYFDLGDYSSAREDYDRALNFDRGNIVAYYNRACVCHKQGRYLDAIADFTVAIERDPNYAEAYVNRGLIRDRLGEEKAALADLRRGARCFCQQGRLTAYQKILDLIKNLEKDFSSQKIVIG
jgi:tetratricopeptide (TPR) repeat protein